jgi:hypothetical protein
MGLEEQPNNIQFPYWTVWDIVDVTGIIRYELLLARVHIMKTESAMVNWLDLHNIDYYGVYELSDIKHGIGFADLATAVQFHMMFAETVPSLY